MNHKKIFHNPAIIYNCKDKQQVLKACYGYILYVAFIVHLCHISSENISRNVKTQNFHFFIIILNIYNSHSFNRCKTLQREKMISLSSKNFLLYKMETTSNKYTLGVFIYPLSVVGVVFSPQYLSVMEPGHIGAICDTQLTLDVVVFSCAISLIIIVSIISLKATSRLLTSDQPPHAMWLRCDNPHLHTSKEIISALNEFYKPGRKQ